MEFQYTVDPASDAPIMLLDDEIGYDPETGAGIPADRFCRELMFLDTLGKSVINIWINSPGGSVIDGMQIFNTILKTKTKVDTHNVGMCASIAAPIFLAGRNRYMMNNTVFMVHPVSGGDDKSRQVFENCVNTMIASRSFLTPETVKGLMDATTWLNAGECQSMGLCQMDHASDFNKQRAKPDLTDVSNAHFAYKQITNSAIQHFKTKNTMPNKVTNKLKLVDGANEDAQVAAIDSIENRATEAENKLDKAKADIKAEQAKYTELENKYKNLEKEIADAKAAAETAKTEALKNTAKTVIAEAVKAGKIGNDAKNIEMWEEDYVAAPERTKAKIDAIPLNKKGAKVPEGAGGNGSEGNLTNVIGSTMAEVRNKLNL